MGADNTFGETNYNPNNKQVENKNNYCSIVKRTKMNREQQSEYLKEELAKLLNDDKNNPVVTCHVDKQLFIEMVFCFIAKHGK